MFTFIVFLLLSGACVVLYGYYNNKIVLYRKQILTLTSENNMLKEKIRKLNNYEPSSNTSDTNIEEEN